MHFSVQQYSHTYSCMHACMHTHMHTHMHACTHTHAHTRVYTHTKPIACNVYMTVMADPTEVHTCNS